MSEKENIENLILKIKNGDEDSFNELLEIYTPLVESVAKQYSHKCYTFLDSRSLYEDFLQEARFGLLNAAKKYDPLVKNVTFGAFAKVCVRNKVLSAVRKAISAENKRKKAQNHIYKPTMKEKDSDLIDLANEFHFNNLSNFERLVLESLSKGMKVNEIASQNGCDIRKVSNAAFRARMKIKTFIKVKMPR